MPKLDKSAYTKGMFVGGDCPVDLPAATPPPAPATIRFSQLIERKTEALGELKERLAAAEQRLAEIVEGRRRR